MNDAWKGNPSEPALRLVAERPPYWEYLLFSQALADALARHQGLKRDVELGISFAAPRRVEPTDLLASLSTEFDGAARISSGLAALMNTALPSALGPPGVAGDPEAICHVAARIGDAYRAALEWSLRIREISTDPEWQKLVTIASGFTQSMIRDIEEFSERLLREIPEALSAPKTPGSPRTVEFTLTLTAPDLTELNAELQRLAALLGVDYSPLL